MAQVNKLYLVIAALCWLVCSLCPLAIFLLGMTYGPESEPGMDPPWSLHAIDSLFWIDSGFTVLLIWMMRGWKRWLTAMIAIPLLCLTAVLAFFGGLWVSGDYL
jgi:hypothetical protein